MLRIIQMIIIPARTIIEVVVVVIKVRNIGVLDFFLLYKVLDWRLVYFVTGINVEVDLFYSMLFYMMDTFAPKRLVRVRAGDDMCGVRYRRYADALVVL
jgi:hypothetical protein